MSYIATLKRTLTANPFSITVKANNILEAKKEISNEYPEHVLLGIKPGATVSW